MNNPLPRQHVNIFDPLKYGFKSLISLPYTALNFFGLFIFADILNSIIINTIFKTYTLQIAPVPFFVSPSNLRAHLYTPASPIHPIDTIMRWLDASAIHAPWYTLAAFAILFIFVRTVLYTVIINIALRWYDTGTVITKQFIPKPYSVIYFMMLVNIGGTIMNYLPSIALPYVDTPITILLFACMLFFSVYLTLRYCFLFYYMIDTRASLTVALQNVKNKIWRINILPLLLATSVPSFYFLYWRYFSTLPVHEPLYALFFELPITYWVSTFALVSIYRKLFSPPSLTNIIY